MNNEQIKQLKTFLSFEYLPAEQYQQIQRMKEQWPEDVTPIQGVYDCYREGEKALPQCIDLFKDQSGWELFIDNEAWRDFRGRLWADVTNTMMPQYIATAPTRWLETLHALHRSYLICSTAHPNEATKACLEPMDRRREDYLSSRKP